MRRTVSHRAGQEPHCSSAIPAPPLVRGTVCTGRKSQVIDFQLLPSRSVGDPEFELTASASSGLPVSFSSSNPQVAVVEGNIVKITGGGTAFLSASQAGNDVFYAAPMVIRLFTVNKLLQTISFENLPKEIAQGTSPFLLHATATSCLPVIFTSSNSSVISIDGNQCSIVGTGNASISCSQFGNSKYDPALPVIYGIAVKPVTADGRSVKESVSVFPSPMRR